MNLQEYIDAENYLRNKYPFNSDFINALNDSTDDRYQIVNATSHKTSFDTSQADFNDFDTDFDFVSADVGTTLQLVSTDVSDTMPIILFGLDINKDMIQETVILTGTLTINTTNTFTRLNAILLPVSVSVGDITISGLGFTWGFIGAGKTNLHPGRYSIPRNYSFVPEVSYFYSDKVGEYKIIIYQKLPGIPAVEALPIYMYQQSNNLKLLPTSTHGPADISLQIRKLTGSGTLHASGIFNGILVKDE